MTKIALYRTWRGNYPTHINKFSFQKDQESTDETPKLTIIHQDVTVF